MWISGSGYGRTGKTGNRRTETGDGKNRKPGTGEPLDKKYHPDYVCYGEVIVEIKAIGELSGVEEAQLINYLKATGLKVGLLINFGAKSLEHKRFVYNL